MPEDEIERRTEITNRISRNDFNITVEEVGEGPLSIESSIEEFMSVGPMLHRLRELRNNHHYDAIIIGCAGDPGLRPARELMDIPIIGPAESSYFFACMVADRFSILLTPQAGMESDSTIRAYVRTLGLESRLAEVSFINSSVTDMWSADYHSILVMVESKLDEAQTIGAGCMVLGCMSMAFHLIDDIVRKEFIPIVNPLKTAIKTAEAFVDSKMIQSRLTYPPADLQKLDKTLFGGKEG